MTKQNEDINLCDTNFCNLAMRLVPLVKSTGNISLCMNETQVCLIDTEELYYYTFVSCTIPVDLILRNSESERHAR